jgi:hypothetical protein
MIIDFNFFLYFYSVTNYAAFGSNVDKEGAFLDFNSKEKNIQVDFSLTLEKIIIAIQIPYCHYIKAKGLFGSFLV